MKKSELIETARHAILKAEGVEDNARVMHYKRAEKLVGAAFDELLQILAKKGDGEIESGYMKDYYNQTVYEASGIQYIELPAEIAILPNGAGVWYVKPTGSSANLVASTQVLSSAFRSIPAGGCINDTFYRIGNAPSGMKAIILQHIGDSVNRSIRKLDFGLIRSFDGYNDNDDIHLPEEKYSYLIEKVVLWAGQRYNDLQNNGK